MPRRCSYCGTRVSGRRFALCRACRLVARVTRNAQRSRERQRQQQPQQQPDPAPEPDPAPPPTPARTLLEAVRIFDHGVCDGTCEREPFKLTEAGLRYCRHHHPT